MNWSKVMDLVSLGGLWFSLWAWLGVRSLRRTYVREARIRVLTGSIREQVHVLDRHSRSGPIGRDVRSAANQAMACVNAFDDEKLLPFDEHANLHRLARRIGEGVTSDLPTHADYGRLRTWLDQFVAQALVAVEGKKTP